MEGKGRRRRREFNADRREKFVFIIVDRGEKERRILHFFLVILNNF
jgi:hypothetical protein